MRIQDVADDFIGCKTRVIESRNSQIVGVEGIVIDETKNTFTLRNDAKSIIIPKERTKFQFKTGSGEIVLKGDWIRISPENRLKESKRILRAINRSEKIW
ncbi:MAG: ribonuclease P component 1 family protein [Thermoplasmataceae archaeon]